MAAIALTRIASSGCWMALVIAFTVVCLYHQQAHGFSIREMVKGGDGKRATGKCPAWHPFECPSGDCVPIKYLCDGSPDCSDGYDENESMCTAATRPPVEETASFLGALLNAHGPDFLSKVFGPRAANRLKGMGGVDKVAVALSQSPTVEVFGTAMEMNGQEVGNMLKVMQAILDGDDTDLAPNEAADFAFFAQKLHETGFF